MSLKDVSRLVTVILLQSNKEGIETFTLSADIDQSRWPNPCWGHFKVGVNPHLQRGCGALEGLT